MQRRTLRWIAVSTLLFFTMVATLSAAEPKLTATWKDNYLVVKGEHIPGGEIRTLYLEAFCKPGSTDRDWGKTVIPHKTELISTGEDGRVIRLRSRLEDGVIVDHTITVGRDEVDFQLTAKNPTKTDSLVDWAQPCLRVDKFTGTTRDDARELYPDYIEKCFLFLDGKLTRLPTKPWATVARYTPGQVYVPKGINRDDVNPRPLSSLVPSNGLTGAFSKDEKWIVATAWEPYQEIFQGVITCMHSDFRIGGLKAGETKTIRGKLYLVPADVDSLTKRYEKDFPEHVKTDR
ncbi:MAG: hypothetical protein KDA84_18275 [Planctomycetaceae bacterium]|nr:hypothetical protein [Planctomycetaceae bacterium]